MGFNKNVIIDCGTGLSLPHGVDVEANENVFIRTKVAIEVRDKPSALAGLGLRDDTPAEVIAQVIEAFNSTRGATQGEVEKAVARSGIGRYFKQGLHWGPPLFALYSKAHDSGLLHTLYHLAKDWKGRPIPSPAAPSAAARTSNATTRASTTGRSRAARTASRRCRWTSAPRRCWRPT